MRKFLFFMAILFLMPSLCAAAGDPSRALAEELLELNNVRAQVEQLFAQMKTMVQGQLSVSGLPAESQAKVDQLQARALQMLEEEMSWEVMKEEYISLYAGTFTADELQGIIDFSKSPLGRKVNAKMPDLMQKSMAIGQQHAQQVLPKIGAAVQEFIEAENAGEPAGKNQ